jgi:hypothetical protein
VWLHDRRRASVDENGSGRWWIGEDEPVTVVGGNGQGAGEVHVTGARVEGQVGQVVGEVGLARDLPLVPDLLAAGTVTDEFDEVAVRLVHEVYRGLNGPGCDADAAGSGSSNAKPSTAAPSAR